MNINRLRADLIRHEGEVNHAYQDSEGYLTIGVGRLIDKRRGGGITHEEAMYLLDNDIKRAVDELLTQHPFVRSLGDVRQEVLANMAFNMGLPTLNQFQRMWAAIEAGHYHRAAREMLHSKWAHQVGRRATELAECMRTGEW